MTDEFALPEGRYFPTGEFLGIISFKGKEGSGIRNFKGEVVVHPAVLGPVFEGLQECPDAVEFTKICSKIKGFTLEQIFGYLQEQELITGLGGDIGFDVLDDLMLRINLEPLEGEKADAGKSCYFTNEGVVLELNPFSVAAGLINNVEVSLMEAAMTIAAEFKLDPAEVVALIADDIPTLIVSGGGYLEVIR